MTLARQARIGVTGLALLALAALPSCAATLPRYSWHGAQAAARTMTQRDDRIRSFSATCRLLFIANGGKVELSGVLIARPPSHLRLRASKLSQTVFDLTLTPDGLFVFDKRRHKHGSRKDGSTARLLTREGLIEAASLLPGFSPRKKWQRGPSGDSHPDGDAFSRSRPLDARGSKITCSVDKDTLTTTRFDYLDDAGTTRQSITFSDYRSYRGVAWPIHVLGSGTAGTFEMRFDDVQINPELPARAFVPPRRAVKQP